jgi:hypothetical protein
MRWSPTRRRLSSRPVSCLTRLAMAAGSSASASILAMIRGAVLRCLRRAFAAAWS